MRIRSRPAEPYAFPGGPVGCLVIHGFTGTPGEVRPLGEALAADGHAVVGVRLAGHGTRVEELARTRWPDWLASARDEFEALRRRVEAVVLVGFSMGGLIALTLAAEAARGTPARRSARGPALAPVIGVVAMAPPFRVAQRAAFLVYVARWFVTYVPKSEHRDPAIAAEAPAYDVRPLACVTSLFALARRTRRLLGEVRAPVLVLQGLRDHTVHPDSARIAVAGLTGAPGRVVWFGRSGHLLAVDVEREAVAGEVRRFVEECAGGYPPDPPPVGTPSGRRGKESRQ